MIVYALDCDEAEEPDASSRRHPRPEERSGSAEHVGYDFHRMVVESTDRVRDDEAVVVRVDVAVEELVVVHVTMDEVLTRVEYEHGD